MPEGALYCEHCGAEIHIVPDFEPELEENIQQIIESIREDIGEETQDGAVPEDDGRKTQSGKRRLRLALILMSLVLAATLGMGVWVYLYNSETHQINRAVQCVAVEQYDRAIAYFNRALELDEDNIELRFSLAEVYFLKNNKIEYEHLLREIVKKENATAEQLDRAYGRLIAIYRDREDYVTINELLLGSNDEQLMAAYQNYISNAPEFSVIEGYYTSIQALKLTAIGNGKIYYTLDGTDPDEESTQYTMPILLEDGDYVVKAVFVNDYGIVSEVASKEYHIDNDEIPAPEISIGSGTYNRPVNIGVLELEEDDEVYYTTDGSDPSYSSTPYTGSIPMPLGKSVFKFARVVDGVTGDVAERTYELILNTEFTPEQAGASIVEYALSSGKIYDEAGHFDESGAMYIYEFLYVSTINQNNDCYVFAEVQRAEDGSQARTGNYYAVNIYDGTRYKLQRESGRSTLTVVESNEISVEP